MKFSVAALALGLTAVMATPTKKIIHKGASAFPFAFTSTFSVYATPEEVVNPEGVYTGGLKGSKSWFNFGINSHEDVICYNISVSGFQGEYQSPALTATHIHQGAKGKSGPPRVVFPDPEGEGDVRTSIGCIKGPFVTGVKPNGGPDAGEGFTLSRIEQNPTDYYVDIHSSLAVPGAVRGQFKKGKGDC
ncbi:hypothetical protein D7B24_006712 [Verticillium nonalfalfae]|uniref:CHRD domain-containing protein n=2 Tax=Verticillium TaxID=1036719 RepID=C9SRY5_VERA1|nr:conserved hypothetical protein [Verticillium alfalfae VaMs.102]XP_028498802.1 uncharacterized protein D7B24_006712 [Verticillium nonalfalfae]EEY21550.1 conserved hypothetical protein [Verticillium alfalfae VaMs.102]RNJ60644.1 hypothetical protein D7B24_006712 [Verticillium nonalfalfae]